MNSMYVNFFSFPRLVTSGDRRDALKGYAEARAAQTYSELPHYYQNLACLKKSLVEHGHIRFDSSGKFYSLSKPYGIFSILLRIMNLFKIIYNEGMVNYLNKSAQEERVRDFLKRMFFKEILPSIEVLFEFCATNYGQENDNQAKALDFFLRSFNPSSMDPQAGTAASKQILRTRDALLIMKKLEIDGLWKGVEKNTLQIPTLPDCPGLNERGQKTREFLVDLIFRYVFKVNSDLHDFWVTNNGQKDKSYPLAGGV